jgi:hypothetical protein
MCAEQQHKNEARNDRGYRERQVNQGDQNILPREAALGDAPGGRHAEDHIQRHRDCRNEQRQKHCRARIRGNDGLDPSCHALAEGFDQDDRERQHQKQH